MIGHVAGLDIGSSKAVCLIAEVYANGTTNIVGRGSAVCRGLKRGSIVDMQETVQAIRCAVQEAEKSCDVRVEAALIGITGEHIEFRAAQGHVLLGGVGKAITAEDVQRAIAECHSSNHSSDREVLDVIPWCYRVDGRDGVNSPVGVVASRLEVRCHVVTGKTAPVRSLVKAVEDAGVEVIELVLEPLAAAKACLTPTELTVGTVILDIGGNASNVAYFHDGALHGFGLVPVGSWHVTSDVAKLLRTSQEEAERLKLEHGSTRYERIGEQETVDVRQVGTTAPRLLRKKLLAEIIHPRAQELLQMAKGVVERFDGHRFMPGGLVLIGGGAKLDGVRELAEEVMGAAARIAEPADAALPGPEWVTPVGIVHCAAESMREQQQSPQPEHWLTNIRRKLFEKDT